jgi:hypothetical protein
MCPERRWSATAAALVVAALGTAGTPHSARAQQAPAGAVTVAVRVKLPDSLPPMAQMAGDSFALTATFASNGQQYAVEITPQSAASPMLQGARLKAIFDPVTDSLHAGLLMGAASAAAAGPSGYRIDISLAGLKSMEHTFTDTLQHVTMPDRSYRDLGTTNVVAGIRCENWLQMTPTDTIQTCLVELPSSLQQVMTAMQHNMGVDSLIKRLQGTPAPFGGRHMVPLMVDDRAGRFHMEVLNLTSGAPDAALFTLPTGLMPFPLPFASDSSGQ